MEQCKTSALDELNKIVNEEIIEDKILELYHAQHKFNHILSCEEDLKFIESYRRTNDEYAFLKCKTINASQLLSTEVESL
jgi:hypothetical protein